MEYRTFKDLNISLLGFGAMRLPILSEKPSDVDEAQLRQMVDYALENGVNYFDTAYVYHNGQSEASLGQALGKHPRESFYLADKLPVWEVNTQEDVHRIFDEQLKRCGVEYFDFYLMHNYMLDHVDRCEKLGVFDLLKQKQAEGKIRHLGLSIHESLEGLKKIIPLHPWEFVQLQVNYLDWEMIESGAQYEYVTGLGLPVIVMEPVRGGALANMGGEADALLKAADPQSTPASWALRFAASLPNAITILSGMSNLEQMKENVALFQEIAPVTDEEKEVLKEAAAVYMKSGATPCTACAYCMDCPSGIDIPRMIAVYNEYQKSNNAIAFDSWYVTFGEDRMAHNCTACGSCEEKCPQKINISGLMGEITDLAKSIGYEF